MDEKKTNQELLRAQELIQDSDDKNAKKKVKELLQDPDIEVIESYIGLGECILYFMKGGFLHYDCWCNEALARHDILEMVRDSGRLKKKIHRDDPERDALREMEMWMGRRKKAKHWKYWIASITDACQNRCPGCYRVLQENLVYEDGHMRLSDFEQILAIFKEHGGESIDFVGGEPTQHPDLLRMMELCCKAGIKIWLYTNLREFGCRPELAKRVLEVGGDITVVGKLNVPNPQDPAQRKMQAQWLGSSQLAVDEMWQGLQNLLTAGFPPGKIGVENLLRKANIEMAPQVYEIGLRRGFFVDLEIPTCPTTASESDFRKWIELFPNKDQILKCVKEVAIINQKEGISAYVPIMPHLTGRYTEGVGMGCVAFKQGALLTESDGRVGLCTSGKPLLNKDGKQLNILRDSLWEIFSHDDLVARRDSCRQGSIKSGPCAVCEHWQYCLGGCAALRETLGGIFDSYPLCYLHEWIPKEELINLFRRKQ
ncbi:MAG: radical SAM protein [Candidatus Pacebacteria bacterium]|nr:radical SAM protein [Candidatus Paceibacterota bacterium]